MKLQRASGVLMHISSLPSKYGIGSLGKESRDFIDFLSCAEQKYWQILPISPTGFGDSPYQSFSVYAGNPYFISIDRLVEDALLTSDDAKTLEYDGEFVDYAFLYENVYPVLYKAFERFTNFDALEKFSSENIWLDDYALFMALKKYYLGKAWNEWDEDIKFRRTEALEKYGVLLKKDIDFYKFLQYEFFKQWREILDYAHSKNVKIIGDIPIYVSFDSADVWVNPDLFLLDEEKMPKFVAGFPPDAFSENGQLWGNPLYDWERHKLDGFSWWISRMAHMKNLFDIVRIDHFIGFARYYAIPYEELDARKGEWRTGVGKALFDAISEKLSNDWIIAEDLGIITNEVRNLLEHTGFYGMKVLQFAFDDGGRSEYLPQNYKKTECIVYTSTHDTNTICGFLETAPEHTRNFISEYMGETDDKKLARKFIELAFKSTADIAIISIQDLAFKGEKYRMNIPAEASGNWSFRAEIGDFNEETTEYLKKLTRISFRN